MLKRLLIAVLAAACLGATGGDTRQVLRVSVRYEPRTLNPLLVDDDASELVRYLTGGVLIRMNRLTQALEPGLALSWTTSADGKQIRFRLRKGVRFSDGSPFSAADVAFTVKALTEPSLQSPTADAFRTGSKPPAVQVYAEDDLSVTFAEPVASLPRLFDQVAILSSRAQLAKGHEDQWPVLGPFRVAERVSGSHWVLARNPNYWKRDAQGRTLPYLDSIRLVIQGSRDLEALALTRGEIDLIWGVDPVIFDKLQKQSGITARDAGPALDGEFLWFNQSAQSRLPAFKQAWFRSQAFRNAISSAINRTDLAQVVYRGHARSSVGPFPPSNRFWFNSSLPQREFNSAKAKKALLAAGFSYRGTTLFDPVGHPVGFSLITNAGNKSRERIGTLIQRDLEAIGINMVITTLDFPGLMGRITRTFDYDACLLGLVNMDADPNGQMNVWLSSSANHQWNPSQKAPGTAWEADIDKAMLAQAKLPDDQKRKAYFDQVQKIIYDQEPFVYLVHPNVLVAYSDRLNNVQPATLGPQALWNAETLYIR